MTEKHTKVLVVDDEQMNLDIVSEYLGDAGYHPFLAESGDLGLRILAEHPDIRVILLDRMMPGMDGLAFMRKLRQDRRFRDIPVIMQTAASSSGEILEGLRAGVFYYLTKPFEKETILAIVRAAQENRRTLTYTEHTPPQMAKPALQLLSSCRFSFRTTEEAETTCNFVAQLFPDPSRVLIGLNELACNAIEHGNLGIGLELKNRLILEGQFSNEMTRRLSQPKYADRKASLTLQRKPGGIEVTISDQGEGFDTSSCLTVDPLRVTRLNGRGIAIARVMSFDRMEYTHNGRSVTCWVADAPQESVARAAGG